MQLNLKKALFLSSLLAVALCCEAAPGVLNTTATPPLCNGVGGAAKCLISYQQSELEAMADPGMLGASLMSDNYRPLDRNNPAGCSRAPVVRDKPYCSPGKNKLKPRCDPLYRTNC